jgi:hypothetical protein
MQHLTEGIISLVIRVRQVELCTDCPLVFSKWGRHHNFVGDINCADAHLLPLVLYLCCVFHAGCCYSEILYIFLPKDALTAVHKIDVIYLQNIFKKFSAIMDL